MRLLLVRPDDGSTSLQAKLEARGDTVEVVNLSTLQWLSTPLPEALVPFDALWLTSQNGVKGYHQQQTCQAGGAAWKKLPAACVGPATAKAARKAGLTILFEPEDLQGEVLQVKTAADAAEAWLSQANKKIDSVLWPCNERALETARPVFESYKVLLTPWPLYRVEAKTTLDEEKRSHIKQTLEAIDQVVFTSPSSVQAWRSLSLPNLPSHKVRPIGLTTLKACNDIIS